MGNNMKKLFILFLILSAAVFAQNNNKAAKVYPEEIQLHDVIDADMEAMRTISFIPGIHLDTIITVTTTPTKLSGYLDTLNISFVYLYNNTSGAILYVGGTAGVLTSGVPVSYQGSFTDNIGFYKTTTDLWLVASGSTDVRIKLKYR